jgi:hypothetical protein
MQERKLGNSKLEVSALGLGCMRMSFGDSPVRDKQLCALPPCFRPKIRRARSAPVSRLSPALGQHGTHTRWARP